MVEHIKRSNNLSNLENLSNNLSNTEINAGINMDSSAFTTARSNGFRDLFTAIRTGASGTTVDLMGDPLPHDGFFVGGASYAVVFTDDPTSSILRPPLTDYFDAHPNTRFMGMWRSEGKIWVEAVTWVYDVRKAQELALARNEKFIYDIRFNVEISMEEIWVDDGGLYGPLDGGFYGGL